MRNCLKKILAAATFALIINPLTVLGQQTGPLGVVNQFPPHMMFLTPCPKSPTPLGKNSLTGALALDYFSVYSNDASSHHGILMDMEATVLDFRLAYGVTERLDLTLRIPLVSMGDGYLDQPLEKFHNALGLPNYGKEKSPTNRYAYIIATDKQAWFDGKKGGLNLTDMTLGAQFNLHHFAHGTLKDLGLNYEVKAPTGDTTYGFGSGAFDHGLFLPAKLGFSRFNAYLTPGYIWVGNPEMEQVHIAVRNMAAFFIGTEFLYSSTTSLMVQINSYTSPFRHTGVYKLDTPSVELALGARWNLTSKASVELSFCEDLTRAAPDFNLHLMLNLTVF